MAIVTDPRTGRRALIMACRSCNKPVYWGYTAKGKRCPYDVTEDGEPTEVSHFTTCNDPKRWSKR
jgi:hypothetical protein